MRKAPPKLLTQKDLAARWGMSERWIEKLRANGTGPAFVALGDSPVLKTIRYRLEDVEAYEESRRRGENVPERCRKAMQRASDCLEAVAGWNSTADKAKAVIDNIRAELRDLIGEA